MINAEKGLKPSRIANDFRNIVLLAVLYIFQGIFGGLLDSASLVLQGNGVTYGEQGIMTLSQKTEWLKILWAPLIESLYYATLGKRKSWLIPTQYLLGFIMLWSSFQIETWLGNKDGEHNLIPLCLMFLISNILLNAMEVVVDSWALTMLRRENVGYQAPCNVIGYRFGNFLGYVIFILLRSEKISGWLGQESAILSFPGFMQFWSVLFLIFNTGVLFFKPDNSSNVVDQNNKPLGLRESYTLIWRILKMRSIQTLCFILLFSKTGLGPIEGLTQLKFIREGLQPEKLVMLSALLLPVQWMLPFVCKKIFQGSRGLVTFSWTLLGMVPIGVSYAILIWFMPQLKENGNLTMIFYVMYFVLHTIEDIVLLLMSMGYMSFLATIADKKYAAVYLTVIHTIRTIGYCWPAYLSFATVELLTIRKSNCVKELDPDRCILVDGYYLEIVIGCLLSVCFLRFGAMKLIVKIQSLPANVWKIPIRDDEQGDEIKQLG